MTTFLNFFTLEVPKNERVSEKVFIIKKKDIKNFEIHTSDFLFYTYKYI